MTNVGHIEKVGVPEVD